MEAEYTDSQLVAQVLRGQKNSFSLLIQRYQQDAFKLSVVILQNKADAEDAVGEAFIKAFAALPRCREDTNFKSWFLTITYHCCQDILRKRKKSGPLLPLEEIQEKNGPPDTPLQALIHQEEKKEIWSALNQLNGEDRTAIIMKYYHGSSYQEIADTLKWPLGTVASRLHRAREKMRRALRGGGTDEK